MKKIYSFVAALVVAMVVLVSCASENTKNVTAFVQATLSKDVAQAETLMGQISAKKAELNTDEMCGFIAGINGLINIYSTTDQAKAQNLVNQLISLTDEIAAKDAEGVKKFAADSNVDIVAIAKTYKDALAAAQQAAEQAAQQAAAEENAEEEEEE